MADVRTKPKEGRTWRGVVRTRRTRETVQGMTEMGIIQRMFVKKNV